MNEGAYKERMEELRECWKDMDRMGEERFMKTEVEDAQKR